MTTNLSLRMKPGPITGRGGRPPKENSLNTAIRIDAELKSRLEAERKPGERFNDVIPRLFRERVDTIKEKEERIARLEEEVRKLKALAERLRVEQGLIIDE